MSESNPLQIFVLVLLIVVALVILGGWFLWRWNKKSTEHSAAESEARRERQAAEEAVKKAERNRPKVFISYAQVEHARVAKALNELLEGELHEKVFYADGGIPGGAEWLALLKTNLAAVDVVVMLLDRNSYLRPWLLFEAGAAWASDKRIVPWLIGTIELDDLPAFYSTRQAIRCSANNDGPYELVQDLRDHLKKDPFAATREEHLRKWGQGQARKCYAAIDAEVEALVASTSTSR